MSISMIDFYPGEDSAVFSSMLSCYARSVTGLKLDKTILSKLSSALRVLAEEDYLCCLECVDVDRAGNGLKELLEVVGRRAVCLKQLRITSTIFDDVNVDC